MPQHQTTNNIVSLYYQDGLRLVPMKSLEPNETIVLPYNTPQGRCIVTVRNALEVTGNMQGTEVEH